MIGVYQAGFENVVSPMGTALTEDQMRLLKRFSRRIVLALDPDAAGQHAVMRGLEAARQSLDRTAEIAFDARGLLKHEARLQADLRVASMPDDLDPDEVVQRDSQEWARLIKEAVPVVEHVMHTLAEGKNLNDAKVKTEIAGQVMPLIADLPNPIERDTYRQMLARFLHLDERSLISQKPVKSRKKRVVKQEETPEVPEPKETKAAGSSPTRLLEEHCLGVLIRRPHYIYRINRLLGEASLSRMEMDDFGYTDHRELFRLINDCLEQEDHSPEEHLLEHVPGGLKGLVKELLARPMEFDPLEERVLEDLLRTVLKIRRLFIDESINQLRFLQEESQEEGKMPEEDFVELVNQARRSRQALDHASRKINGNR